MTSPQTIMEWAPNLREELFSLLVSAAGIALHSRSLDFLLIPFLSFLALAALATAHDNRTGCLGARDFAAPGLWASLLLFYVLFGRAEEVILHQVISVAFVMATESFFCRYGGRVGAWLAGVCATVPACLLHYHQATPVAFLTPLAFFCLLPNFVLVSFKNSCTVGEAVVMVQCLSLGVGSAPWLPFCLSFFLALKLLAFFWNSSLMILTVVLLHGVAFIHFLPDKALAALEGLIGLFTPVNLLLGVVWGGLLVFAIFLVQTNQKSCPKTITALRKVFHLLAAVVYVTGILWAFELLSLAAGAVMFAFLLLEILRQAKIGLVGELLDRYLEAFRDERDSGDMIFTPIALHIGLSLPIWLHEFLGPMSNDAVPWAGVIAIAIGDTLAALVGQRLGSWKWPGSHRSLQGSAASWIGQAMVCAALLGTGVIDVTVWRLLLAVTCNVLIEAYTSQIDNLVLPLCFIAFVL